MGSKTISVKNAYLLLLLCCIPLFFLNIHNVHSAGGDDYAQYIKEAKNIAEGKPYYQSNYVFNKYNNSYSPPQYPPGYPLLLAPVIKAWGISIEAICYFNTIIACLLMFGFFEYFRKHIGILASLCLSVLISYSGILIDLKQTALSDQTTLLFVLLYLVFRNAASFPWHRLLLLTLLATMAVLIRTQAILLLFAEGIWLLLAVIKQWKIEKKFPAKLLMTTPSITVIAGTLLLSAFLNKIVFFCPSTASGFYADFLSATFQKGILTIIRDNISFFLESIRSFFHYETDKSIRTAMVTFMECSGLVLCVTGFLVSISRRLSFDDIFFIFSCGLMLYYPIHDARYFLPAIAILYFYCFVTLERILPALTNISQRNMGIGITLFCLVAGFKYFKDTTHHPYDYVPEQTDTRAFMYIKQHISDSDIILCPRPRLLTLYTDKKCMVFAWQHSMEENKRVFDSLHVKYVLLMKGIADDYLHAYLNNYGHPADSTDISPGYRLYTLAR